MGQISQLLLLGIGGHELFASRLLLKQILVEIKCYWGTIEHHLVRAVVVFNML